MPRPTGMYGSPDPYLAKTGQTLFDTAIEDLPPVTAAVRQAFTSSSPVATADVIAALFVAVHTLETRLEEVE